MNRPGQPTDPLLATLLEEASHIDTGDLDLDVIAELVEEVVAPFNGVLTPQALDEARMVAAVTIMSAPDFEQRVARHREESGTRAKHSPERLVDAAQRRRNGHGGRGAS